jgi:hypothetical protein
MGRASKSGKEGVVNRFQAEPYLEPLKDFQRATVEHVMDRFYRNPVTSRRFLVADETGLGKSVVARGVIARTIEHLQDDDSVDRIDVVYVCSNSDIADQNLKRLNVTDQEHLPITSRLTMLAKHSRQLAGATAKRGKPVNLVSFTPGTSFDIGWRLGKAEERALLHLLLKSVLGLRGRAEKSSQMLLQGGVQHLSTFANAVQRLDEEIHGDLDPLIAARFAKESRSKKYLARFEALIDDLGRKQSVPQPLKEDARLLIAELRAELARASVETLEPDLVILDEFQRFRHLLDIDGGGEAAELAHQLFDYGGARVLLLSATPYKPFTLAEEGREGEDHFTDFVRTLDFLAQGSPVHLEKVESDLVAFRASLIAGSDATDAAQRLRKELLLVMARTERPQLGADDMLCERSLDATPVDIDDLVGFTALRRVADAVESHATVEYWKSVPYFINFIDGYQLGGRVRTELKTVAGRTRLQPLLARTQRLNRSTLERFGKLDLGNGRLRALAADTVEKGWWRLLWVPPSMPYFAPGGPYADSAVGGMTKRLIFSSWAAAPTAIASLLSYESERHLVAGSRLSRNTPAGRAAIATRLNYDLRGKQAAAMTTLALFWPHPVLAVLADPLALARAHETGPFTAASALAAVKRILSPALQKENVGPAGEGAQWRAMLTWPGAKPELMYNEYRIIDALAGVEGADPDRDETVSRTQGLRAHMNLALDTIGGPVVPAANNRTELLTVLAELALHSPANIAYRSLGRLLDPDHEVSEVGHWEAAATLAAGLRTLFNRLETTLLLDKLYGTGEPYWRHVLRYCADGNLQAVMDEYLHHLRSAEPTTVMDDDNFMELAAQARDALSMLPSRYLAFDPDEPDRPLPLLSRFAVRYGGRRLDQQSARQPQIRNAFNSPFWPFVLATTSIGQEGIDLHWWCHAAVHWNVPSNPVDFEQREGRVNRFGGHAVRRNIADKHRASVMASSDVDPWKVAYDAARDQSEALGEFAPYWIYPGLFKVERQLLNFPLSRDAPRAVAVKDDLALYRLALGQPRQEDLLDFLKRRGANGAIPAGIDLRPERLEPQPG